MIPSPRALTLVLAVGLVACAQGAVPKPPELKGQEKTLFNEMRTGRTRLKDPDVTQAERDSRAAIIKKYAQYLAYSLCVAPFNGEPEAREPGKFPGAPDRGPNTIMSDAETATTLTPPVSAMGKMNVEQLEFGGEFGAALAEAVKVVIENSARPIERVNAMRLLAVASKMPAPGMFDFLISVVNNAQAGDALKIYAFQAMRGLLEQTDVTDPLRHITRDNAKLAKVHDALAGYIFQKRVVRDDRERAVIEFVRRDAVAALGKFKEGTIAKPTGETLARPAWSAMRVIERDPSVVPTFSLQEVIEATIGFCSMRPDKQMNLDVAAYFVAKSASYFAASANEDAGRARGGDPVPETLPILPWKIQAARLSFAVAQFRENCRPAGAARFSPLVTSMATVVNTMLDPIEKVGASASTQTGPLDQWGRDNPPKAWTATPPVAAILFQDDPTTILPFPAPVAPKTPPMTPMLKTPDPKASPVPPVKKP